MKKIIVTVLILIALQMQAQTGIGTTTPNTSAKLDVYSDNKGFLPPRVSLTGIGDATTIPSPATGLLVYCKGDAGLVAGYYYWNGNAWATIATAGGSGSFAASYMRGSRTTSQTLNVNDNLIYNTVDNTSGSSISLNTTTGKITLTAGNTYRLMAAVPNFSGSRPSFSWYNETSGTTIGSSVNGYNPSDAAGNGSFGGVAQVIITPNVNTVVYLKLVSANNSSSTGTISTFANGDFLGGVGYPWFEAQVISGNAPVTGQSVDYVQASLSANQTLSAAGNINFNTSSGAGITLSSGGFNLIANKTYKLEAALGGTSGGYAYYGWVDSTNTLLSGGSIGTIMKAGSAYVDAPQDKAVVFYTPTTNTTVYLRVLTVSGGVTAYPPNPSTSYSSAWATIQQVGSSAIVNPWVLSGNDVYNITGEVGIGTNAPASSALLDLSSSSKGVLIPRMTAAQKTAISSPTTGLLIFQTDASTGFYYYNGSSWISISEPNWTSAGTIQSVGWSATTTAPTIGTTAINDYSYKQIGAKTWKCQLTYSAGGSTGANIGSGDYLFTLPNGLQFNTSVAGQATYTGDVGSSSWIWPSLWLSSSSGSITNLSQGGLLYVVPYSSTQFRLIHVGIAGVGYVIPYASGYYGVGGNLGWRVIFTFQSL